MLSNEWKIVDSHSIGKQNKCAYLLSTLGSLLFVVSLFFSVYIRHDSIIHCTMHKTYTQINVCKVGYNTQFIKFCWLSYKTDNYKNQNRERGNNLSIGSIGSITMQFSNFFSRSIGPDSINNLTAFEVNCKIKTAAMIDNNKSNSTSNSSSPSNKLSNKLT